MPFSREYYQTWLLSLEARQLEIIEIVLKIEVEVYEIQKLLLEVKEIDEYDNFIFGNLIFMEIRFKIAFVSIIMNWKNWISTYHIANL